MNTPPILGLFLVCAAISAALAVYAWRHRTTIASRSFAIFSVAIAIYGFGYAMELSSPDLASALFWSKVQYVGILTFPTMYLVFALQYTGHESWLTPRNFALLFVFPVFFFIMKMFDDSLHWLYASTEFEIVNSLSLLRFTRGALYLPLAVFQLVVVTVANFLLVQKWRISAHLFRTQTAILLLGAVIPYLTYIIYLLGVPPHPSLEGIDINPLSYAVWAAVSSLGIFRYRLLELAPIARASLIERLEDGVVVLDAQARVVDANPEALKIFHWPRIPIGEFAGAMPILGSWINIDSLGAIETSTKKEVTLSQERSSLVYELTSSALEEKNGARIGYLIVVHDVSSQKAVEKKLQELSLIDDLTGLHNRRGFWLLAEQLIGMANRIQQNAVVFYIDLDGLKAINDRLGHAAGDQALKDAADVLNGSFRSSDIVARLSGDEFIILALESKDHSTAMMLKRLEEKIRRHNAKDREVKLSMSIGQAHYQWRTPRALGELIKEADLSMYDVKRTKGILRRPI